MKCTFRTEEFADIFTPNIPDWQKQANIDWLQSLADTYYTVTDPNHFYPVFTNQGNGVWEYESTEWSQSFDVLH